MAQQHHEKQHILVIGAGIIGLQCALTILSESNAIAGRYKVSIVAEHIPGDEPGLYASAWAGAQWRSHESSYTEVARWDVQTYEYWRDLCERGERDTGIAAVKGLNYWATLKLATESSAETEQTADHPDPWWSAFVSGYRRLSGEELPPDTVFGSAFDTFTIDVQRYMAYVLRRIHQLGGQLVQARLPSDQGLEAAVTAAESLLELPDGTTFAAVVNASGIHARELVGDKTIYPVRGQTVRVRGVSKNCITKTGPGENDRIAVMPRPDSGTTTIGVTVEPGVESTEVNEDETPKLLQAAKPFCPELLDEQGNFHAIKAGVGIRPGRKGGARVEEEKLERYSVIHAYGVSGAGYQNSIGLAREVLKTLQHCTA